MLAFSKMSHAFVRDEDGQTLNDIAPTLGALVQYLTTGNNGVRVYERRNYKNAEGRVIHEMSDGLSYSKDEGGRWIVLPL
ncbi:MAG TPA: hypothetical protein VF141_22600 [Chryseolinea sp.]